MYKLYAFPDVFMTAGDGRPTCRLPSRTGVPPVNEGISPVNEGISPVNEGVSHDGEGFRSLHGNAFGEVAGFIYIAATHHRYVVS